MNDDYDDYVAPTSRGPNTEIDHEQRLSESMNWQHFLLMNLRSDPSDPHECDIMKSINNGNDEEFR